MRAQGHEPGAAVLGGGGGDAGCAGCGAGLPAEGDFCEACGAFLVRHAPPVPVPRVKLSLARDAVAVEPGGSETLPLVLRNTGRRTEEYLLRVTGPDWIRVDPERVRVKPGGTAGAVLEIAPPRHPSAAAGAAPFRLDIGAAGTGELVAGAGGMVEVTPFGELTAELRPGTTRGRRRTRHVAVLSNGGNQPLTARVHTEDTEGVLGFDHAREVGLGAGESAAVPVTVLAARRWFGRQRVQAFTLTATADGQPAAQLRGTRVVPATLSAWAPPVALLAAGLVVALAVLLLGDRPSRDAPLVAQRAAAVPTATTPPSTQPAAEPRRDRTAPPPSLTRAPGATALAEATAPPPGPVPVPAIAGGQGAEAEVTLLEHALVPRVVRRADNAVPAGTVIGTEPGPGERMASRSVVTMLVSAGPTPSFDLVANGRFARWRDGAGALGLGPSADARRGSVLPREGVLLEDGTTASRTLETRPQPVPGGTVSGEFTLPAPVIARDRFLAQAGFPRDGGGGAVTFRVELRGGTAGAGTVVRQVDDAVADSELWDLDVDLGRWPGATTIVLSATVAGEPGPGQPLWVRPRVEGS